MIKQALHEKRGGQKSAAFFDSYGLPPLRFGLASKESPGAKQNGSEKTLLCYGLVRWPVTNQMANNARALAAFAMTCGSIRFISASLPG